MENNWFKKPGDLENNKPNINGSSFFKQASSLEEPKSVNETFFKPAEDLDTPKPSSSFTFEEKQEQSLKTSEEIIEWLTTIVSGEKKASQLFEEGLKVTGAGQKFVSIEELQNMVKNGDNIIKAEYFDNMNMVMIEFESFSMPSKSR